MEDTVIHIGLDNIDSPLGGCTTHFTYRLIKYLLSNYPDIEFIDYPNLVRLNPSIPFKTRGNGAVVIRIKLRWNNLNKLIDDLRRHILDYVEKYALPQRIEAGVAVVIGDVGDVLRNLYIKALTDYVPLDYIEEIIKDSDLRGRVILPLGLRRGVIGALSSIGALLSGDCTYELILYRAKTDNTYRCVDGDSVKSMDTKFSEWTFSNYDYDEERVLVSPHGPDPVLLGIRGEDPLVLLEAVKHVRVCEEVEGWLIFRTNQGTDAHYVHRDLSNVRPFQTGCIDVMSVILRR